MKILFVVNNYYATGNGLSASARRTVEYLKKAGQDVRVLSGPNHNPDGPQPDYLLEDYKFPLVDFLITSNGSTAVSSGAGETSLSTTAAMCSALLRMSRTA